jgi:integrase
MSEPKRPWKRTTDRWIIETSGTLRTRREKQYTVLRFQKSTGVKYVEDVTSNMVVDYLLRLQQQDQTQASISSHFRVLLAFLRWCEHCPVRRETIRRFRPYRLHAKQNVHLYTEQEYQAMLRACDTLGERPLHGKLTPAQVLSIKRRFAEGERNRSALARAFGVTEAAIRKIIHNATDGERRSDRDGLWWTTMLAVLYGCGLRLAEGQHLIWRDIHLEGQTSRIHIREHRRREGLVPWRPKGKLARIVPIPPDVHDILLRMRQRSDPDIPYVFLSSAQYRRAECLGFPEGCDLLYNVLQGVQRIQRLAGTHVATIHELRHTFVTRWATRVSLPALQMLAGHQDIKTTLRVYTHLRQSEVISEVQAQMWREAPN